MLDEQEAGILGRRARGDLKRLPSSVYWAALGSWGLFVRGGSLDDYHAAFDRIREGRARARKRDDADLHDDPLVTWHAGIPHSPPDFPEKASFALRRREAVYLRDRIRERHSGSLLAWLVKRDEAPPERADFIWQHSSFHAFPQAMRELVGHARIFAEVMVGAAIVYNLELARERRSDELVQDYQDVLRTWVQRVREPDLVGPIQDWNIERFWQLVIADGHTVTDRTRAFVQAWTHLARQGSVEVADSAEARSLVRARERALKRAQSRFDNRRALDQWTGASGLGIASYRWPNVQVFLDDLWGGLTNDEEE